MFCKIEPDYEAPSCNHRQGDPDCDCHSTDCIECGTEYLPAEGHCCLDRMTLEEIKVEALELLDTHERTQKELEDARREIRELKRALQSRQQP